MVDDTSWVYVEEICHVILQTKEIYKQGIDILAYTLLKFNLALSSIKTLYEVVLICIKSEISFFFFNTLFYKLKCYLRYTRYTRYTNCVSCCSKTFP